MENKANFTLIGAVAAFALFAAALFTVWLGNTGFKERMATYDVMFKGPVRGLEPGGEVRFNGIKVGEVTTLRLSETNANDVLARIKVSYSTPVRADSVAQLEPAGLTGLAYIQIMPGSSSSPLLRQRIGFGPPIIRAQRGQLDRLFQGSEGVIETTLTTLARLNALLNERNIQNINLALANLERASGKIAGADGLLDDASVAANGVAQTALDVSLLSRQLQALTSPEGSYGQLGQNLVGLSAETTQLVQESRQNLASLSGGTETLVANANDSLARANRTFNDFSVAANRYTAAADSIQSAATSVDNASRSIDTFFTVGTQQTLPDLTRAANDVRNAANTFDSLAQEVQRDPGALLTPPQPRTVRWRN